eukprot:scaffold89778_cov49-Phaeocystis_antarctica.AAC.2
MPRDESIGCVEDEDGDEDDDGLADRPPCLRPDLGVRVVDQVEERHDEREGAEEHHRHHDVDRLVRIDLIRIRIRIICALDRLAELDLRGRRFGLRLLRFPDGGMARRLGGLRMLRFPECGMNDASGEELVEHRSARGGIGEELLVLGQ